MNIIKSNKSINIFDDIKKAFNDHYGENPKHLEQFSYFNTETEKIKWINLPKFQSLFDFKK